MASGSTTQIRPERSIQMIMEERERITVRESISSPPLSAHVQAIRLSSRSSYDGDVPVCRPAASRSAPPARPRPRSSQRSPRLAIRSTRSGSFTPRPVVALLFLRSPGHARNRHGALRQPP
jgi:hypothetical protein